MADYLTGVDTRSDEKGATLASGVQTVIIGPLDLLRYPKKAFTVYNQGIATLSGAIIQINPDRGGYEGGVPLANPAAGAPSGPNAGLWENYDTTTFRNIASGGVKTGFVKDDVARWWRVLGLADLPNVTASGWLHATSV